MNGGDPLSKAIATMYYTARLTGDQLTDLVGAMSATRLRLLKADLEDEPLDLATPDDVDIYEGDVTTVDTGADDDC
ncbi:hypothetical protein [Natrinema altunense]|uniref:Uncharacterized protein n=1 Tax=Natrinema altunense (strain JCM 12890 / CGMCC 1.3731 / AJ2) TaxID=1227494 RepID=L9ZZL0_NATA2|nr:hypothetical protein [Natrinema altunense]ELY91960.1 hypothetical protein C485_00415 [Natrinema altunense JCM 12890]